MKNQSNRLKRKQKKADDCWVEKYGQSQRIEIIDKNKNKKELK